MNNNDLYNNSAGSDATGGALLERYRRELLRWNARINLVSRAEAVERVEILLQRCVGAAEAAGVAIADWDPACAVAVGEDRPGGAAGTRLAYVDLGSGAGLPGVPWCIRFLPGAAVAARACLVEPRTKRAWFLERVVRLLGLSPVWISAARWGNERSAWPPKAAEGAPTLWLISLMALRLTDSEILAGLRRTAGEAGPRGDDRLVIARLRSPGGTLAGEGVPGDDRLDLPPGERRRAVPFGDGPAGGTLLLSLYGPADLTR